MGMGAETIGRTVSNRTRRGLQPTVFVKNFKIIS